MQNLTYAEIIVTTRLSLEKSERRSYRLLLSNYGDYSEFYAACCVCFADECDPVFVYLDWDNIPECLIRGSWLCPHIFEIRDALQKLEEEEYDFFFEWCRIQGHDLATDEVPQLVTHYRFIYGSGTIGTIEEPSEEDMLYEQLYRGSGVLAHSEIEIFTDDYN